MEVISRYQEHSWGKQITPLPRNPSAPSTHFGAYLAVCRRIAQVPSLASCVVDIWMAWKEVKVPSLALCLLGIINSDTP